MSGTVVQFPRKKRAPPSVAELWPSPECCIEQFLKAYPCAYANARDAEALEEVRTSGEISFAHLMEAVKKFAASVAGRDPKFIPGAARWLHDRRWEWIGDHLRWVNVSTFTVH